MGIVRIFTAPERIYKDNDWEKSIFLAGTIDMGNSINWQFEIFERFYKVESQSYSDCNNLAFYNPRRKNFDSSQEQNFENPYFYQQVNWELDALDRADVIFMNLLPDSKSPISLLELGLYAGKKPMVVVCPEKFWRRGNIEIVCHRYNIPLFNQLEKGITELRNLIINIKN